MCYTEETTHWHTWNQIEPRNGKVKYDYLCVRDYNAKMSLVWNNFKKSLLIYVHCVKNVVFINEYHLSQHITKSKKNQKTKNIEILFLYCEILFKSKLCFIRCVLLFIKPSCYLTIHYSFS